MSIDGKNIKPGLVLSVLDNKCSRCRRGRLFKFSNPYSRKFMEMHAYCTVCKQDFDPEVGFYYGTGYVSYGLCIIITGITFLLWCLIIGVSANDNRVYWWIGINSVLLLAIQPLLMRLSRSIWLACIIHYNPNWETEPPEEPERVNEELKNAW